MTRPDKPLMLAFMLLLLPATPVLRAEEVPVASIHGKYSLLGAIHRTGGSGDRTLLKRGEFLTHEVELESELPLWGGWNSTTTVHTRNTKDDQIDSRDDWHLLGWTTDVYNEVFTLTGGDFYGDFSQYSLQQSLKGAQVAYKTESVDAKGVFGYSKKADESRSFLRYVGGGHANVLVAKQLAMMKELRFGANMTSVEDDHSTIHNTVGVSDAVNRVGTVTMNALLWDITDFEAELARSWSEDDTSPGSNVDRQDGTALRLHSNTKFSKMDKLRLNYEWVSSRFNTLAGSAVPDRVNLSSRWDHKWNSEWSANANYRVFYDKLEESTLNKRTLTQSPRAEVNWMPTAEDWLLENYNMRVYWDERTRVSQDDPSGQTDFASDEWGLEQEFKVFSSTVTNGWSIRNEDDDRDKTNDRLTNSGFIGVRRKMNWFGWSAVPSLRYQFDYTEIPKSDGRDLTQTVSESLRLDISESLYVDQRLSVGTASRLAHDSDSVKLNAYLGLDYRLPTKLDMTFRLNYEYTNFAHDVSTQRFNEQNLQSQLLWKF